MTELDLSRWIKSFQSNLYQRFCNHCAFFGFVFKKGNGEDIHHLKVALYIAL